MASDQSQNLDAINTSKFKDLPPLQTHFQDKPLPAIREPPPRSSKESGRGTPNPRRTERGYRRLNPKSSLFHLFSRPKVEKQRGFNEPGFIATPVTNPGRETPSPELSVRQPSPATTVEIQPLYRRPSTSLSVREDPRKLVRSRTPTSEDVPEQDEDSTLPTLFDVYSDSSKVTIALAIDESSALRLTRPRKSNASHVIPAIISEERRGSVDSGKGDRIHRNGRNSLGSGPFQRKIFALCNDGLILQYSEKGGGERLPERALQLTPESAAFACDLIPGRPYVLQIDQKASTISESQMLPPQSLLTKMGLKDSLPRLGEHSLLLILDTAEELTSWMNAVRKQILSMGLSVGGSGEKTTSLEKLSATPPKLRVRQRASISQQESSLTNFSFPREPAAGTSARAQTSRPRRDSNIAPHSQVEPIEPRSRCNSSATGPRKPLPERDGVERLKNMSSFDTTESRDSPLSIATHDSAVSFGTEARKHIARSKNTSQKSSFGSLEDEYGTDSPVLPRSMTMTTTTPLERPQRPGPNPIVDRPRPDSFVADLPLLWPARKPMEQPTPAPTSSPAKELRSAPAVKRLPLKVNSPNSGLSVPRQRAPSQSPSRPAPSPSRSSPSLKSVENFSRRPQRTPSVKLSLFPSMPDTTQPSSAPATVKPLPPSPFTPGDDVTRSQDRPLRRPASIQVRANHAPFLSSVRPMVSAPRPQLSKAESTPCLRNAALPRAPETKKPSSSPLPPLDLGMPIVGLAPPAPPPSLPLPKLPPSAPLPRLPPPTAALPKLPPGAQQKALVV